LVRYNPEQTRPADESITTNPDQADHTWYRLAHTLARIEPEVLVRAATEDRADRHALEFDLLVVFQRFPRHALIASFRLGISTHCLSCSSATWTLAARPTR
jgi:hypothetical protein